VDVATRARNQIKGHSEAQTIITNRRLSLGRVGFVIALLVFFLLERGGARPGQDNIVCLYLIIAYLVYTFAMFGVVNTIARQSTAYPKLSLYLDVVFTLAISWFLGLPVFALAYLPALMLAAFTGLTESTLAVSVVGIINILYFYIYPPLNNNNLISLEGLTILVVLAAALLFPLILYLVIGSNGALLNVGPKWLDKALASANEENLVELQNRVQAIYRVSSTLTATLDYQKVIRNVLNEIEMVFEISVGAVMFFEGTADSLKVADSEGLTEAERKRHYNTSKGILKEALAQAKPILVNDEETLEEWCKLLPSLSNCRTALIMPLRGGFEVYGLLLIASNKADKYHESDLQLMVALTSHTIVAMQNATLYRNLLAERNKMLTAEEEVRHTLARNLHDGPAQAVASFSMQIEFIRRLFRSEPDRAMSELILLGKTAQQTSKEIRTLLYELRPLVLESQGLEAALEQYAARFPTNPHDPAVYFSTAGEEDIHLNSNVETTIFTILQEAVNNARKHAEAKNIWLQVEFKEGFVIAVAQDDGKGFDTSDIELNYDKRGSLGLINMRERATLVGGKVTIESKPGKGTRVMIRIPLTTSNLASEDPIETVS
jgi:signal transduction histidine kinase